MCSINLRAQAYLKYILFEMRNLIHYIEQLGFKGYSHFSDFYSKTEIVGAR